MEEIDKILLKRWLVDGDLKGDDLENFKQSSTYADYHKIISVADSLETPLNNGEALYSKIEGRIKNKPVTEKVPVRKLNISYISGIAAAILVLIGVFIFMKDSSSNLSTGYGETYVLNLPDGSKATLNSNATLSYDEESFNENREIKLVGEAYFEVRKGSSFVVHTDEGSVTVLGTKFNVDTSADFFAVQCFSGKVRVDASNQASTILTKGKSVRIMDTSIEKIEFDSEDPTWIKGISSFENIPFSKVVLTLENQFNLKIFNTEPYVLERFTGSFSNKNQNNAIQTVFEAMGLEYSIDGQTIHIK